MKKKLKLHNLLMISNAALIVLLVLVMGSAAYMNSRQLVLEKAFQYQSQRMDHLLDYLSLYINEAENAALTISENTEISACFLREGPLDMISQREDRRKISSILASTANTKPYLLSINVLSTAYSYYPRGMMNDLYHEEEVDDALARQTFLSVDEGWITAFDGAFLSYQAGNNSGFVHFFKNMRYRNGATRIATVVVTMDPDRIMGLVCARLNMSQGTLLLVDGEGQVLYGGGDIGTLYTGSYEQTPQIGAATKTLSFVREVPSTGWRLVYTVEVSAVTTGINEIYEKLIVIGLAVLLLSVPATAFVSWRISSPVRRLAKSMSGVEERGFRAEPEETVIAEMDSLWGIYRGLLERIRVLIAAIRAEQERKRRAQLKLLQAQINPHFIYNSIELINWKARRHHAPEISEIVYHLGRMLRTGLNRGEDVLTIGRELEHVESYLTLQTYKYEDSFAVRWQVEEGVKDGYTIKLLLQPLVENCIYHGFSGIGRKGEIRIAVRRAGDDVEFSVEDNGKGMTEEELLHVSDGESQGYGVRNIDERITLRFGAEYGLRYYATDDGGAGVRFRIPYIADPAALQEDDDGVSGIFD